MAVKDLATKPEPYFLGIVCASAKLRFSFVGFAGTVAAGRTGGYNVRCPKSAPNPISGFFYLKNSSTGKIILAEFADTRAPGRQS